MPISRRTVLKTAVGAGVVAAIPAVPYAKWVSTDRTRPDPVRSNASSESGLQWSNWSGSERANPEAISVPESEARLAEFIGNSTGQIRPVGSGHSFSGLVPSDGTIVDLSRFSGLIETDKEAKTARIWAGTRLRQGARQMAEEGLGMMNLPDIDVQTFAGSFATATHGTGASLSALHDHVVGMRMITPSGYIIDIDRETNPELFQAAKVSLGSLGVITSYDLQLRDTYSLNRRVEIRGTEDILDSAQDQFEDHRHFEFYFVPNSPLSAEIMLNEYEGEPFSPAVSEDDDELLVALEGLRNHLGWAPWLRKAAVQTFFPRGEIENSGDEYWRMLTSSRPSKFHEIEYHIPLEEGFKALREIVNLMNSNPNNYFPMEVRRTAGDDAWLSPFNDGPRISIAVHAAHNERYDHFFTEVEPIFRKYGGRPHWGKLHSLTYAELSELYPRFSDFVELREQLDPTGRMLNTHLSTLFQPSV